MTNSLQFNIDDELDIIDLDSVVLGSDQTWLTSPPAASVGGDDEDVDVEEWLRESCLEEPRDPHYQRSLQQLLSCLDNTHNGVGKQKFSSRTYTRPKKRVLRPSLQAALGGLHPHLSPQQQEQQPAPPALPSTPPPPRPPPRRSAVRRNDTFNVDDVCELTESQPININLSEPAHNLHNTFNRLMGSAAMRSSSLANMSPPSLVSSIAMDSSGNFNYTETQHMHPGRDDEDDDGDHTAHNSICSSMTSMTMSILDEKEMNTSILSATYQEDLMAADFLPPPHQQQLQRASMDSSLINSATFTDMLETSTHEDSLPNGKPKFQLRKSFLKPDPEDNFDKFLMLNSKCNTDDLRGLSAELTRARISNNYADAFNDTFTMDNEKENMNNKNEDMFLLGDGMSDSFLKDTGRESLNITYNKLPSQALHPFTQQRLLTRNMPKPPADTNPVILPGQTVLSARHQNVTHPTDMCPRMNGTYDAAPQNKEATKLNGTYDTVTQNKEIPKLNGTYDAVTHVRESPKRNGTFRKLTPPSSRNVTGVLINTDVSVEDVKRCEDAEPVDSNKEGYVETETVQPSERRCWTPHRRKDAERSMGGGSSDSLEQETSSGGSSPPQPEAKVQDMDDLTNRALQQEQKLYQMVSTPISRVLPDADTSTIFPQSGISPILRRGTPQPAGAPSNKLPSPEHAAAPAATRKPFLQKSNNQRTSPTNTLYGTEQGPLYSGARSATSSPAKSRLSGAQFAPPGRPLSALGGGGGGLPTSKLRQYSSHRELHRIPGPRWGLSASRSSLHASNPALAPPAPLIRQASYTLLSKDGGAAAGARRDFSRPAASREVTHTTTTTGYGQPLRAKHNIPSLMNTRSSLAPSCGQSLGKAPAVRQAMAPPRPAPACPTNPQAAMRSLPRPSGLPRPASGIPQVPRKTNLRPPSTYSLAPRPGDQPSDCY